MMTLKNTPLIFGLSLIFSTSTAIAQTPLPKDMPTRAEMWQMILHQQEQIKKLETIVGITTEKVAETEKKIEATGEILDQVALSGGLETPHGNSGATTVGGYAELHYNGGKKDQIDQHRFVIFLGHEFSDKIRFYSELEVEHAISGSGEVGAVEMEQAFVEFDLSERHRASVGMQLVPVGIINETHEPPTFYGVERNNVEKNIIPTTWREAGVMLSGNLNDSFSYDVMMHSGLDTTGYGYKIRKGRQQVGNAPWKNTAVTTRVKWHGLPGVKIAASFQYQDDITQSGGIDEKATATLFEINSEINRAVSENSAFGLRALYAQWNVRADAARRLGRNIQRGWYVEPSYKITLDENNAIGFFARYSLWDNEAGDNIDSSFHQTTLGVSYWPHENVILKLDYQIDNFANSLQEDNRVNLGLGLQF
ncbi:MAG TPA: porin [Sphingomonadales bacterium]|nr:porin [Sphingomonadales bacterium]